MKNYVSPTALKIVDGPTMDQVNECIARQDDATNAGVTFTLEKMAYDKATGSLVPMLDRATGKPVTGTLTVVVQVPVPISQRPEQKMLLGHTKGPMILNGQPLPLAKDNGQEIDKISMSEASEVLSGGINAGSYVKLTYDSAGKIGEVRTFITGGKTISLLALRKLTGMDHESLLPLPLACCEVIGDDPLTFNGGGGGNP